MRLHFYNRAFPLLTFKKPHLQIIFRICSVKINLKFLPQQGSFYLCDPQLYQKYVDGVVQHIQHGTNLHNILALILFIVILLLENGKKDEEYWKILQRGKG